MKIRLLDPRRLRRGPVLALALLACSLPSAGAEETLFLFARHAEKQSDAGNPDLTERGLERAAALRDIALEWGVEAVYSTDLCRTAQTAEPTAQAIGVPIAVQASGSSSADLEGCDPPIRSVTFFLDPAMSSAADLLSWILEQHAGGTVLVVGHSNTVPRMIGRLGGGAFDPIRIEEDEYDRLFLVTFRSDGDSSVVERSYGDSYAPVGESAGETGAETEDAVGSAPGDSAADVVAAAIERHGGARYEASRSRLTVTSKSGGFDLEVIRDGGSFDYTVRERRDESERITRLTNDTVSRSVDGVAVELDDEGASRARDFVNARVYFPFLPYGLEAPSVTTDDQGLESWEGRSLRRVKVTFAPGSSTDASDEYAYWFDPETGRLEQYAYSFGTDAERGGLRFRRLSNYREVGGILFFDAANLGIDGEGPFSVDRIVPGAIEDFRPISEVVLTDIEVEALR